MNERSVTHATFVLERTYDASAARVFAAWADPALKARWFVGPDEWQTAEFVLDFRVGGREINRGGPKDGPVSVFQGLYQDIVPDQRIIYTYDMYLGERRISVSLATVELEPEGARTRLVFTEQGAFLDGYDNPAQRERGTVELLDGLGEELRRQPANA
jgi:uncharacterized protein YndB with AHSA1/START domain